jgi:hypothetical protein
MIELRIDEMVFVGAALVGGGLLLITVLVDDVLGGMLDALHLGLSIGGVSLAPPLIAFVAMFGVGGIFASQVLGVHEGGAALVGVAFGLGGFILAYALFRMLRRSEGERPFALGDLVGHDGSVSVAIPAGRLGSVYVRAEGQTHEIGATAARQAGPDRDGPGRRGAGPAGRSGRGEHPGHEGRGAGARHRGQRRGGRQADDPRG